MTLVLDTRGAGAPPVDGFVAVPASLAFGAAAGSIPTKNEFGEEFPAAAYAYVGDPTDPSTWQIRLWETLEAKVTAAQVSRAVAALGASFRGTKVAIPAGALPSVKTKILSAWMATHQGKTETDAPGILRHASMAAGQNFSRDGMPPLMKDGAGKFTVQGLTIFKVGSFKDSLGRRGSYSAADLEQIVENFRALRDSGVFAHVPVRSDHSDSIDKVVAYIDNLYTDGEYLYADIEFTQATAVQNYSNGTYRNRSIELGPYETNSGETYYPVCLGFAFVDIPAVEGLFSKGSPARATIITDPQENTAVKFRIKGIETDDATAIQAHIDTLETAPPAKFRVAGAEVSDFAAVQAHIDRLETFESETMLMARDAFVDGLVTAKKIAATQTESLKAFARTLAPAQFDAFKAGYDAAPTLSMFGQHAGAGNGSTDNVGGTDPKAQAIADLEEIVAMHKRAGATDDQLAKNPSYIQLQVLRGAA